MKGDCDRVEIVIEKVRIGVQRYLRALVPEHPLKGKDVRLSR
jgi:hypothetical protein